MTAKKKTTRMPRVEIEDSVAKELANVQQEAKEQKLLITGFVVILETYDGHRKKLKVKKSHDLPDWSANGMVARVQGIYADDPDDDDADYNPEWYWNQ
jgi:hypothetical protein